MNDDLAHAIAAILGIVLWTAGTFASGIYVLRPLDRAARQRRAAVQFTLLDFFALTAHISVPLAFIGQFSTQSGSRSVDVILVGFGCFSACLIWWGTVRTAARAGIAQPLKRFLMIGIVVPITFVASFAFGIFLPYLACRPFVDRNGGSPLWLYFVTAGLAALFIAARRIVDWILRPDIVVVDDAIATVEATD